jgi:simple sugar transport system substrate-binding protein
MQTMSLLRSIAIITAGLLGLATAAHAAGLPGAPAPFDKGGVRIAVVNFIGGGDWLQAFEAGTKRQADALKVDLRISEARQDPDAERRLIEDAINQKVRWDHHQQRQARSFEGCGSKSD